MSEELPGRGGQRAPLNVKPGVRFHKFLKPAEALPPSLRSKLRQRLEWRQILAFCLARQNSLRKGSTAEKRALHPRPVAPIAADAQPEFRLEEAPDL